jgi:hypothetical protein
MNTNSTKGKKQKPADNHITLVTHPTKLVQPYKTTSSAHTPQNGDNLQHKKSNIMMPHFTPTPVSNPVFHRNPHLCQGLLWSANLLQLSASKQVFLLILASILI